MRKHIPKYKCLFVDPIFHIIVSPDLFKSPTYLIASPKAIHSSAIDTPITRGFLIN